MNSVGSPLTLLLLHPQPWVHSSVQAAVYLAVGVFAIKPILMLNLLQAGAPSAGVLCLDPGKALFAHVHPQEGDLKPKTRRGELSWGSQALSTPLPLWFLFFPHRLPRRLRPSFFFCSALLAKLRETNCKAGPVRLYAGQKTGRIKYCSMGSGRFKMGSKLPAGPGGTTPRQGLFGFHITALCAPTLLSSPDGR